MKEKSNDGLLEKCRQNACRFTDEEIKQQRYELAVYILTELTGDDIESIQEGIAEVRALTGLEFSLEDALRIRKLATEEKTTSAYKSK